MKVNNGNELAVGHTVRAKRSDPDVVKAREHFYANNVAYRRIFKAKLGYNEMSQQAVADKFRKSKTMRGPVVK
ncbi:MAG: hypothetical protein KAW12_19740 [Candidatus Aminicenantes bacterium]|nr:hypothetical protein [Candidatus Aminicenantes bacterium]